MMNVENEPLIKRFLKRQGLFMGTLMAILRDLDAASEVFQNAAVVILENPDKEDIRDFDAWAKEVVRRQAHQYLNERSRHRTRCRSLEAALQESLWQVLQEDRSSDDALAGERRQLQHCVQKLPGKWRDMMVLRYEKKSSFDEIGRSLGGTAAAVQRTLSRIRKALHDCVHHNLVPIEES